MKVGIIGGSFNPIHFGHLRMAEDMRETLGLSKVIFVPAKIPPHKEKKHIISASHRFNMVAIALSANPWFEISDIEIKREGISYSIDTINLLKKQFEDTTNLYLLMGMDSFREIHTWKNYEKLFTICNIAVMTRPGVCMESMDKMFPKDLVSAFHNLSHTEFCHRNGFRVEFVNTTFLDISAHKIRGEIAKGKSVKYLLPPEVEGYIYQNGLYK
ncbi:MAG: nicotinate-nucleotide adenylyltransferase [Thermodesulfobacteriota bacterium]|nr:nicotinate-nucleotide adenylyltransferase [Thermodesulfobacteriota bacterium]